MISEYAQNGFDFIFKKAVLSTIPKGTEDICEIEIIGKIHEIKEPEFSVLTIATTSFRALTLFHFNSKDPTHNGFERGDIGESSTFRDSFLEFCNMCSGAMVRDLHPHCHFMGMSTPYVLKSHCLDYITSLNPGFTRHYRIVLNNSYTIHATLCVCNYGVVDFKVDTTEVEESTGELELF